MKSRDEGDQAQAGGQSRRSWGLVVPRARERRDWRACVASSEAPLGGPLVPMLTTERIDGAPSRLRPSAACGAYDVSIPVRRNLLQRCGPRSAAIRSRALGCLALLLQGASCDSASLDIEDGLLAGSSPEPGTTDTWTDMQSRMEDGDAFSQLEAVVHKEFGSIVVVSWEQGVSALGWVEFSFDDGVWLSSPHRDRPVGHAKEQLLGIPYGTHVQLRLVLDEGHGSGTSQPTGITTEPLPAEGWTDWKVLRAQKGGFDEDVPYFLVSLSNGERASGAAIIDRQARFVWMRLNKKFRCTMQAQPSFDGTDLLIDENSFYTIFDNGDQSQVLRMKIDGTMLETYDTVGLHHPFTQGPDGSIIWTVKDKPNETIERLFPSGKRKTLFSCDQITDTIVGDDYCGSNTLRWHEPTNTLLYSMYTHETVLEIDPEDSKVLRIFGHQKDAYAFDPDDSGFWWQHGAHYTQAGTIMTSSYVASGNTELVVREYEIDHNARVLRLIWSFGEGEGVESRLMGEAHRLPSGNTLHNFSKPARLREITPEGEVVWDIAKVSRSDYWWELGSSIPIADLYAFAP